MRYFTNAKRGKDMETIAVIDGMGGGIGVQIISRIKGFAREDIEIIALGTNGVATERMVKAGAKRGASGENAIRLSVRNAGFILGPVGIVIANSMMGEISPAMAEAILSSPAERILLPLQNEHFILAGVEALPLTKALEGAVEILASRLKDTSSNITLI
jgi:hypothetical protein